MNEPKTSSLAWGALGAALGGSFMIGVATAVLGASHDKRPSAAYDTIVTVTSVVNVVGVLLLIGAVVAGIVALFQANTRKVVPAVAVGCGGLPLLFVVLALVVVGLTGGR